MSATRPDGSPGLAGRIDPACDRFESAWLAGARPRLEDFLEAADLSDRPALLRELLGLELEYRRSHGERPTADDYRGRLPDHAALIDAFFTGQATVEDGAPARPPHAGGAPNPTLPDLPAGEMAPPDALPGYDLLEELGRGGMGVVYRAVQRDLGRVVALKMILAGPQASFERRERFHAEAEAVARLQHPNIVQIHEIGAHDGRLFFSMEFCPGGSLDKKLHGTPLKPADAARLVATLARAVEAAHRQSVVHRDLKPANILLTADGTPKVSDFGLAKRLDTDSGLSVAGQVFGTPSYMAPEQAGGQTREVGPAADVYALGAILYQLLTGRAPFRGPTALDTVRQVLADEPAAPRRLQPRTPKDLETICLKCLQKAPARRYVTAEALAEDLERFLAGRPILARPTGAAERLAKWARREPASAALVGAVALLAVLIVGWFLNAWRGAEAGRAAEAKRAADEAEGRRQVEHQLYFNRVMLADRERAAGKPAWAARQLDLCPEEFREWEWRYLRRSLDGGGVRTLDGHDGYVSSVAACADGSAVASASGDGTVRLWDPNTGKWERKLTGHDGGVNWVAFSPDGERVAGAGEDGRVVVWDRRTGNKVRDWKAHDGPLSCVAFRPDGRELATAAFSGPDSADVRIWQADTGELLRTLHGHEREVTGLAYSPDGSLLATASHDRTVRLWDGRTGGARSVFRKHSFPVAAVAFRPDGRTLASAAGMLQATRPEEEEVLLWSVPTGEVEHRLQSHTRRPNTVAFSPDGARLATGSLDGEVKLWDTEDGLELLSLAGDPKKGVTSVGFTADGRYLVSGGVDQRVRVWDGGP